MILTQGLIKIILDNQQKQSLYVRNLLKEELQNYVLAYIYNDSKYNKLIFTGGTCLRKVYGLNRLSEDLDFDTTTQDFDITIFGSDIQKYFVSNLGYSQIKIKITNKQNTIFLRFPILKEIGLVKNRTPEDLFVRCDISFTSDINQTTAPSMITAGNQQFLVNAYSLPTMFTNKIRAFLTRNYFKGKFQELPFKGRDIYDIFWLIQLSARSSYTIIPDITRLKKMLKLSSTKGVLSLLVEKLNALDPAYIRRDLENLLESDVLLNNFLKNYHSYIVSNLPMIIHD